MSIITKEDFVKIRRLYRLTQHDIAGILGISQSAVFKIEKGIMNISNDNKKKLAEHFKLTPERLAFIRGIYAEFESGRQSTLANSG